MKNLFKNLMLVAVAAMAFTACTETNDEVNAVAKKTVINGIATIENDDTRSGFVGSTTDEDGKASYQSAWDGGENLKLFINYGAAEATATVDAEGKFTIELDGDYSNCTVTACSPAEAWSSEYSFTIPAEQTPRETSVDPAAHILKAQAISVTNGVGEFKMQHEVSYGKMTVNTPADFEIAKVVINLKGAWYGYDKDLTYTLNAANVKNNTFWFATDTIEVSEMTVTAYDADDNAYTKTITMDENKVLKFQYYKVSTFSVSNLKKYEAPAAPEFTYAMMTNANNWDKLVQFSDNAIGVLQLNFYGCNSNNWIDVGTYGFANSGAIYPGDGYSFFTPAGGSQTDVTSGSVVVSVVDGVYFIEFIDLDYNGQKLNAIYKGEIEGLIVPDIRQPLPMPVPTGEITGNLTATVSWPAIEDAVEYTVTCNCGIDMTTTETSVDLTFPEYGVHYVFVTAIAADDDANYKDSETAYAMVNMEDPRVKIATPSVNVAVDGKNFTFKWDACEGAVAYYVYNYNDSSMSVTTAETSVSFEMDMYATEYTFCIRALAEEGSLAYKDSDTWWFYPKTGYDPNMVPIAFTSCELNEYIAAQWRVSYNFSDGNGNSMTLWITTDHGASDTSFGSTTNYYNFYSSPGSVGNYYRFCPVNIVVNGVNKYAKGGNVSIENLGSSWNINMEISFDDGSMQLFTYNGGIGTTAGGDSGDSGEFTPDHTITSMSFVQLSTSYYTYQWNVSTSNGLSFRIYTPYSQGVTLQEGTYEYYSGSGNTNGDFTFSTRMFSPAPGSGSMDVSKDGDTYTINLTLVVGTTTQKYQYIGTL